MAQRELFTLKLHAALSYIGLENPPMDGLPDPLEAGRMLSSILSMPDQEPAEGSEELFAWEAEALLRFDPDEGPRAVETLPPPRFYGRVRIPSQVQKSEARSGSGPGQADEPEKANPSSEWRLPPGEYAFLQLRLSLESELLEALEWFAREAWWERMELKGPYCVRRVYEDGRLATQIIRSRT